MDATEGNGMKIFGKEPAWWGGVVEGIIAVLAAFFLPHDLAGILTTLVVAVVGVLTAIAAKDTLLAAGVLLIKAVATLVIYFGYSLDDQQVATIIGLFTVIAGGYLRTQTSSTDKPFLSAASGDVQAVAILDTAAAPSDVDEAGKVQLE